MAKKSAKQTTKSTPMKAPQKKPAPAKKSGGSSLLADTRGEAIAHEDAGRWADAHAAWVRVERIAGSKAERKEAAGRAAAAKVRASASASRPVEDNNAGTAEPAATETDAQVDDGVDDDGASETREEEGAGEGAPDEGATSDAEGATGAATGEPSANEGDIAPTAKRTRKAAEPKEPPAPRERDARLPEPGTVIIKKDRHGAERARCTVTETGIEYAGKSYKSLSAAALVAAKDLGLGSKTQDGYAFWGLKKAEARTATKKDPVEALQKVWDRYRERADALVKAASDDSRPKLFDAINQHAAALAQLTGGAA